MPVKMIKHKGKFVPVKKVDGKLVPDENKELVYGADGSLELREKGGVENEKGNGHEENAEETNDETNEKTNDENA